MKTNFKNTVKQKADELFKLFMLAVTVIMSQVILSAANAGHEWGANIFMSDAHAYSEYQTEDYGFITDEYIQEQIEQKQKSQDGFFKRTVKTILKSYYYTKCVVKADDKGLNSFNQFSCASAYLHNN